MISQTSKEAHENKSAFWLFEHIAPSTARKDSGVYQGLTPLLFTDAGYLANTVVILIRPRHGTSTGCKKSAIVTIFSDCQAAIYVV